VSLEFIVYPLLAGIGVALVAGPLGSLLVWRRMANIGDTLAHSTLLGASAALLFGVSIYLGLIGVSLLIAAILVLASRRKFTNDTILCIIAYSTLALGLTLATMIEGVRVDILGYLYGDILTVEYGDLLWIYTMAALVFLGLVKLWSPLLAIIVHEDLARVEGLKVDAINWTFMIMLALVFAVAMKLIGVLLMTALLIIPASAARPFSKTPEQMACLSTVIGILSVLGGIALSHFWDWPAGPAIVIAAASLLLLGVLIAKLNSMFKG
jgi:zinc transport system permease protein